MKRGAAKGVKLPRRKAKASAFEKLPDDPTVDQLKAAHVHVSLSELEDRVADVRDSWETDSLFEDAFAELAQESASSDDNDGKSLLVSLSLCVLSGRLFIPLCFIPHVGWVVFHAQVAALLLLVQPCFVCCER